MTIQPRHLSADDRQEQPEETHLLQSGLESSDLTTTHEKPNDRLLQYRGASYGTPLSQGTRLQWFYDLPVRSKQILGLFTSEAISVVGLVGVSSILIVAGGRAQLVHQAKAELAVADNEYDAKVDQMGSGFRGQSDNTAIIAAAREYTAGRMPAPETFDQVQRILRNEVSAREIEYATLVGKDMRIIASANADRRGEKFDPDSLVGTVLANPRQIETNSIVSWEELQKEAAPLPTGLTDRDALVRYVLTPVIDPNTNEVIGVLVAGDVVNQKLTVVQETLAAFNNGYSAIYTRNAEGNFELATSLDLGNNESIDLAQPNVPLTG